MSNLNKPEITKAFEHVRILSDDEEQEDELNKYLSFKQNKKDQSGKQQSPSNLLINMQALQTKEVDHNIEEIGIMAVRQVKYISEKEWLKLVKMRQKEYQILDKFRSKNQSKQESAMKRERNQKGQFVQTQKKKPIKKQKSNRGRKPKNFDKEATVDKKQKNDI